MSKKQRKLSRSDSNDLELVREFFNLLNFSLREHIATATLKVEFNLNVEDRYEADSVIVVAGSVYFFAKLRLIGIGTYSDDGKGIYFRRNE